MSNGWTLELILRPEVQRLLDHFATVIKVRSVFFASDGSLLGAGRQAGNCAYCDRMQREYFSAAHCAALDRRMQLQCRQSGAATCYCCHAGLHEMIAPVVIAGQIAGYIMLGQFRSSGEIPVAARHDPAVRRAWEELPVYNAEELDNLLGMFRMLLDYIVARELVEWHGDRRMERIDRYLEVHLTEPVRLAQVARHAGCSVSSLTHWLREIHHCSFKELLIGKRLKRADQLFKQQPQWSIGAVAAAVGYDDRHYFSRIYRRYRGCAPQETRGARPKITPGDETDSAADAARVPPPPPVAD